MDLPKTLNLQNPILNQFLILLSLALISFPVKFTLGMGQMNLIAFAFLISSYLFYKEKKTNLAGLLLGNAFLLKPILGFSLIFFVLKKRMETNYLFINGSYIFYDINIVNIRY